MHETIKGHRVSEPLFLFWATHTIHTPLQVPKAFLANFSHVDDERRKRYLAMVSWLDAAVGSTIDLLREERMYDNTLLLFTSDNGGPVYFGGSAGANNWPLRGGKTSNFQGGIRVNAWASGGLVPASMHGTKLGGLMAVWDAYATFAALAGAETTDHRAAAAGLPPVDSINLWPYLSGKVSHSPRRQVQIGSTTCEQPAKPGCINKWGWGDVRTVVQGLIEDRGDAGVWKLLIGRNPMNGWQGPYYPNKTTPAHAWSFNEVYDCGETGCLFRLDADPSEHTDLKATQPEIASEMLGRMRKLNRTTFSPYRGKGEQDRDVEAACNAAQDRYGGFFGPFR